MFTNQYSYIVINVYIHKFTFLMPYVKRINQRGGGEGEKKKNQFILIYIYIYIYIFFFLYTK